MVAKMQKAELKVLAITDQAADGRQFPLNEIDPFTFFANFNRGTTAYHRMSILRFIKEEWKLTAALPEDYSGLPLVNPMKSWFMPFEKSRDPGHVPQLWQFYGHILEVSSASQLDVAQFDSCCSLPGSSRRILQWAWFGLGQHVGQP